MSNDLLKRMRSILQARDPRLEARGEFVVILSIAKDLDPQRVEGKRSFAALRMTIVVLTPKLQSTTLILVSRASCLEPGKL
jgi:hypothetical protein